LIRPANYADEASFKSGSHGVALVRISSNLASAREKSSSNLQERRLAAKSGVGQCLALRVAGGQLFTRRINQANLRNSRSKQSINLATCCRHMVRRCRMSLVVTGGTPG
jgi:hypothetical protein